MSTTIPDAVPPVVAGVDSSEASFGAVRWAADEAVRRGTSLTVVHALGVPTVFGLDPDGRRLVEDAAQAAREWQPGLTVKQALMIGSASTVLCEASKRAQLVVTGTHERGLLAGMFIESVGAHLAAHAACPVLVVHHPERWTGPESLLPRTGPVVVGVDGCDHTSDVLAVAFDEALRHTAPIVAVRAFDLAKGAVHTGAALDRDLEPWLRKHPDVDVARWIRPGSAVDVLVEASQKALMVVVGPHEHHGLSELGLGAVTQRVLHHARCSVLVARTARH
jgi:nucleotide-binding universal stress UspA family protein